MAASIEVGPLGEVRSQLFTSCGQCPTDGDLNITPAPTHRTHETRFRMVVPGPPASTSGAQELATLHTFSTRGARIREWRFIAIPLIMTRCCASIPALVRPKQPCSRQVEQANDEE